VLRADTMSDGDVLQAAAKALAVRTRIIHASAETQGCLAVQPPCRSLKGAEAASRQAPQAGHA
jgi:hypothetical protein